MLVDLVQLVILLALIPRHPLAWKIDLGLCGMSLLQEQVHIFLFVAALASQFFDIPPSIYNRQILSFSNC